jgi:hypothetical protein
MTIEDAVAVMAQEEAFRAGFRAAERMLRIAYPDLLTDPNDEQTALIAWLDQKRPIMTPTKLDARLTEATVAFQGDIAQMRDRAERAEAEVERLRADLAEAANLLRRGARNYADIDVPGGWGDQAWTCAQRIAPPDWTGV